MKEFYLSSYSHLITGADEALVLGLFIDGHNETLKAFNEANESFGGWFKISIDKLVGLSNFSKSKVRSILGKLEKLNYIEREAPQRGDSIKSTYYKLNDSEIKELNKKADSHKVRIVRGYGDYKKEIEYNIDKVFLSIAKETLHSHIKGKKQ
jgi:hypothetical protein